MAQYQTAEGEFILGKGIAPTLALSQSDLQAGEDDKDIFLEKALDALSEIKVKTIA